MGIGQGRYIFFPNLDEFGGILNVSKKKYSSFTNYKSLNFACRPIKFV